MVVPTIDITDELEDLMFACDDMCNPKTPEPAEKRSDINEEETGNPMADPGMQKKYVADMLLLRDLSLVVISTLKELQELCSTAVFENKEYTSIFMMANNAIFALDPILPTTQTTTPIIQQGMHLTGAQRDILSALVSEFSDIFATSGAQTTTDLISHSINTGSATPLKQKPYSLSHKEQKIVRQEIADMLDKGVIVPS